MDQARIRNFCIIAHIDHGKSTLADRLLELLDVVGFTREEMSPVSAKEGTGVPELLEAIIHRLPPPRGDPAAPLRALIFDSKYDPYKGVIAYVRVIDGGLRPGQQLALMT